MTIFFQIILGVVLGFLLSQLATVVTTVYLHRSSTHQSLTFHENIQLLFQSILWLFTGIVRREWVAVHTYHHLHTDEPDDPHSPLQLGFWRVQLGNAFLYRTAAKNQKILQYGKHIKESWAEKTIFRFSFLGPILGVAIAIFLFGPVVGSILCVSHVFFYVFFLNNLVNALCHYKGYKNFSQASAYNNRWVAWITGGEGNHNNHHHNPNSAQLSVRDDEPDFGWSVIQFFVWLGWATLREKTRSQAA